jgi:hypothetical protein
MTAAGAAILGLQETPRRKDSVPTARSSATRAMGARTAHTFARTSLRVPSLGTAATPTPRARTAARARVKCRVSTAVAAFSAWWEVARWRPVPFETRESMRRRRSTARATSAPIRTQSPPTVERALHAEIAATASNFTRALGQCLSAAHAPAARAWRTRTARATAATSFASPSAAERARSNAWLDAPTQPAPRVPIAERRTAASQSPARAQRTVRRSSIVSRASLDPCVSGALARRIQTALPAATASTGAVRPNSACVSRKAAERSR